MANHRERRGRRDLRHGQHGFHGSRHSVVQRDPGDRPRLLGAGGGSRPVDQHAPAKQYGVLIHRSWSQLTAWLRQAAGRLSAQLLPNVIRVIRVIRGFAHTLRGGTAPSPGPVSWPVLITPSRIVNKPGKRASQAALALGTNCRALASIPAFPGTRAAMPAE